MTFHSWILPWLRSPWFYSLALFSRSTSLRSRPPTQVMNKAKATRRAITHTSQPSTISPYYLHFHSFVPYSSHLVLGQTRTRYYRCCYCCRCYCCCYCYCLNLSLALCYRTYSRFFRLNYLSHFSNVHVSSLSLPLCKKLGGKEAVSPLGSVTFSHPSFSPALLPLPKTHFLSHAKIVHLDKLLLNHP